MPVRKQGNSLDKNTLLSLNMDPKSIDLHTLALSKMKNARVDPSSKHDFIKDRFRAKNINNMDDLYSKLNQFEKNGVLDIWINKFGKNKYRGAKPVQESDAMVHRISCLVEDTILEMDGMGAGTVGGAAGTAAGVVASGSNAIAPYGGMPSKNKPNVVDKYAETTLTGPNETHQDLHLGGN